jgi:hypothetical protein
MQLTDLEVDENGSGRHVTYAYPSTLPNPHKYAALTDLCVDERMAVAVGYDASILHASTLPHPHHMQPH